MRKRYYSRLIRMTTSIICIGLTILLVGCADHTPTAEDTPSSADPVYFPPDSDTPHSLPEFTDIAWQDAQGSKFLCLAVGADGTELLVTWQGTGESGHVEVIPAETDNFSQAVICPAEIAYTNSWGTNIFRAKLTDLEPGQSFRCLPAMHSFTRDCLNDA